MIIAIDGTSGSGKSTLAKTLAKKLNFGFFSAGSLYRTITLKALNLHIRDDEDDKLQYMRRTRARRCALPRRKTAPLAGWRLPRLRMPYRKAICCPSTVG